ncbi:alpha/beta hydrolase [Yinghuangia aomiensis]
MGGRCLLRRAAVSTPPAKVPPTQPDASGPAVPLAGDDAHRGDLPPGLADPTGLPDTLVFAGGAEVLLDDTTRFVARAAAAGVTVHAQLTAGAQHVWPKGISRTPGVSGSVRGDRTLPHGVNPVAAGQGSERTRLSNAPLGTSPDAEAPSSSRGLPEASARAGFISGKKLDVDGGAGV